MGEVDGIIRICKEDFDRKLTEEFLRAIPRHLAVVLVHLDCLNFDQVKDFIVKSAHDLVPAIFAICQKKVRNIAACTNSYTGLIEYIILVVYNDISFLLQETRMETVCQYSVDCLKDLNQAGKDSHRKTKLVEMAAIQY